MDNDDRELVRWIPLALALCTSIPAAVAQPTTSPAPARSATAPATRPVVELFSLNNPAMGQPANLRLTRTGPTDAPLEVQLRTLPGGRAQPETDYQFPRSISIPKGKSEVKFQVPTTDDHAPHWARAFAVEIAPDSTYTLGKFYCDGVTILAGNVTIGETPPMVLVNNDDDNDNGITDFQELGPVEREDDLVPLTLGFPDAPPPGSEVHLTVTGNNWRVWECADKSGRLLINLGKDHDYIWIAGKTPPLPHMVWIEAVVPSTEVGSTSFTVSIKEPPLPGWKHYPEPLAALYPPPATKPTSQPATHPTTLPSVPSPAPQ